MVCSEAAQKSWQKARDNMLGRIIQDNLTDFVESQAWPWRIN